MYLYVSAGGGTIGRGDRYILVDSEGEEEAISESNIQHIDVEVSGNGWLYGALAGALVDVTLVTIVAVRYQNRTDP